MINQFLIISTEKQYLQQKEDQEKKEEEDKIERKRTIK